MALFTTYLAWGLTTRHVPVIVALLAAAAARVRARRGIRADAGPADREAQPAGDADRAARVVLGAERVGRADLGQGNQSMPSLFPNTLQSYVSVFGARLYWANIGVWLLVAAVVGGDVRPVQRHPARPADAGDGQQPRIRGAGRHPGRPDPGARLGHLGRNRRDRRRAVHPADPGLARPGRDVPAADLRVGGRAVRRARLSRRGGRRRAAARHRRGDALGLRARRRRAAPGGDRVRGHRGRPAGAPAGPVREPRRSSAYESALPLLIRNAPPRTAGCRRPASSRWPLSPSRRRRRTLPASAS